MVPDVIDEHHVVRAFDLLSILASIASAWGEEDNKKSGDDDGARPPEDVRRTVSVRADVDAERLNAAGFATWTPSQVQVDEGAPETRGVRHQHDKDQGKALDGAQSETTGGQLGDAPVVEEQGYSEEISAVGRKEPAARALAPGGDNAVLLPEDAEVPSISVGYGPDGEQVQDSMWKDREIAKRTLMRGEAEIFAKDVCGNIRCWKKDKGSGGPKQVSLQRQQWKDVMMTALDKYRVGFFVPDPNPGASSKGDSVKLCLPNSANKFDVTQYHNRLISMCGLSYADLMKAIGKRQERLPKALVQPRKRRADAVGMNAGNHDDGSNLALQPDAVEQLPLSGVLRAERERQEAAKEGGNAAASSGINGAASDAVAPHAPKRRQRRSLNSQDGMPQVEYSSNKAPGTW